MTCTEFQKASPTRIWLVLVSTPVEYEIEFSIVQAILQDISKASASKSYWQKNIYLSTFCFVFYSSEK